MASSSKKSYVAPESVAVTSEPAYVVPEFPAAAMEPEPFAALEQIPAQVAAALPALAAPIEDVEKAIKAPTATVTAFQGKVREMIEKGLAETRSNYTKVKSAADEATGAFEASYSVTKNGVAEINAKALATLRASAEANFDFMKSIIGVKSMADYVTLHTEFARKQVEMMSGASKEFGALAKKVAEQSVEPIKAQVAKTFKVAV